MENESPPSELAKPKGPADAEHPSEESEWRPKRSALYLLGMWAAFIPVLALPLALALSPDTQGLAYVKELGLLGWVGLIVIGCVWLLGAAWLNKLTREWFAARRTARR